MTLHVDISAPARPGLGPFGRAVRKVFSIVIWTATLTAALFASAIVLR
jgi:hypothetical protein